MLLDYLLEYELISRNAARLVRKIDTKKFAKPKTKSFEEQIYVDEMRAAIFKACREMFEKNKTTSYLGIMLNFYLGLRVGELCALKISDFDFEHHALTVQRAEVKHYDEIDGKFVRNGYEISEYLKGGELERTIVLIPAAIDLVKEIQKQNLIKGFPSEWLFVNAKGERQHNDSFNHALARAMKSIEQQSHGNHSIRKTAIFKLFDSGLFSDVDIQKFAGHKDFETTRKSYIHPMRDNMSRVVDFEEALTVKNKKNSDAERKEKTS